MQVVYSGGSSTPNPSPRLQRKAYIGGYGRPILPGYLSGSHPHVVVHRSKEKLTEGDTSLRDSIPAMTKPIAVSCLILNILVPGLGTFTAGLSVLCCSEARQKCVSKKTVVWVNSGVALLQFATAFLFLLGWIWSIMWGAAFISISTEYYKTKQVQHTRHDHPVKISPKAEREDSVQSPTPTSSFENLQNMNGSPVTNDKHLNNMYLAPPSSSSNQTQPIIVLQEPPVINHSDVKPAPSQPILNARTRHQKILQRQMSDNQLSPFTLTNERLEAIVIHDAVPRNVRPIRDVIQGSVDSLSDSDDHVGKS